MKVNKVATDLEDVPELLLDEVALDRVLPGQDGPLRAVGVVEHPEDHLQEQRIHFLEVSTLQIILRIESGS